MSRWNKPVILCLRQSFCADHSHDCYCCPTFNHLAFFQLQWFIEYKALAAGVPVVYVDPAYTSQDCPRCGHRPRRSA